jgi:hypothetical protein
MAAVHMLWSARNIARRSPNIERKMPGNSSASGRLGSSAAVAPPVVCRSVKSTSPWIRIPPSSAAGMAIVFQVRPPIARHAFQSATGAATITTGELAAQSAAPVAIQSTWRPRIPATDSDRNATAPTAASARYQGMLVSVPISSLPAHSVAAKSAQQPTRSQSERTKWR